MTADVGLATQTAGDPEAARGEGTVTAAVLTIAGIRAIGSARGAGAARARSGLHSWRLAGPQVRRLVWLYRRALFFPRAALMKPGDSGSGSGVHSTRALFAAARCVLSTAGPPSPPSRPGPAWNRGASME
jgi:hypothetical protein